jgi:hypothetical protein
LEERVSKYVADLQPKLAESINANPQTSEERHRVFLLKKRILNAVLAGATMDENRFLLKANSPALKSRGVRA